MGVGSENGLVERREAPPFIGWDSDLRRRVESIAQQHDRWYRRLLWAVIGIAVIGGIGDTVTSSILLPHPRLYEKVALTRFLIDIGGGYWILLPKKVIILGGAIVLARKPFPAPLDTLPIAGIAAGQIWLTVHNIQVGLRTGVLTMPL